MHIPVKLETSLPETFFSFLDYVSSSHIYFVSKASVMKNHSDIGSAEEHSSDSGWTIYFGSTTQNENENNSKDKYTRGKDDDESEDSMASDASSGPSHHQLPNGGSRSLGHIRHAKEAANSNFSSAKKPCKQFKKKDEREVKKQNEHSSYRAETAASQVSSGSKVRKTKMMVKEE